MHDRISDRADICKLNMRRSERFKKKKKNEISLAVFILPFVWKIEVDIH